ncbi:HNH endonuclease [Actinacidiphila epipremni]|uniref:HNH endonuclease n=1 Tax=Actinacidiphila epipremni TaxID=2053013 RepID=A0ABX0ZKV4_9ACTN|nr:HNH endonuclease signature motif containing protein [Actinacidiphila epipremni]NJP42283.1 HNH endonuclease [Actinacidiphila epipremni]
MPTRPPSRCAEPGCRELTTEGRCDEHKRRPWAGRDDKAARYDGISSGEWRALKARIARRDHDTCYLCGAEPDPDDPDAETYVLDHKTPVAEGGSARDLDNLGLLCPSCDRVKSAAEAERGRQRYLARRRGITPP